LARHEAKTAGCDSRATPMRRFALQAQAVSGLISLPELTNTPSTALSRQGLLRLFNLH